MKTFKSFLVFFSLVYAGLTAGTSQAQTCNNVWTVTKVSDGSAVTVTNNAICINYCASGSCDSYTISTVCSGISSPAWSTQGGLVPGTASSSGNTYSYTISSTAASYCKGRVTLRWSSGGGCQSIGYVKTLDVFKTFSATDLNTTYAGIANLGSPFRVVSEQPPCVVPNQLVTMSVRGLNVCIADEIGTDDIVWSFPAQWTLVYSANDNSSITLLTPVDANLGGTTNITARLGRCNGSAQGSITFNREARRAWIRASTTANNATLDFTDLVQGDATNGIYNGSFIANATSCLPANLGGTANEFTLTCNPDESSLGMTYAWVLPLGYNLTGGSLTTRTITVSPGAGTTGTSNVLSCTVNGGQCGQQTATFRVNRTLVTSYNTVPVPGGVSNNCYYPDQQYTFNLSNAPGLTEYIWSPATVNTTTPYWNIISGQGTATIVAVPVIPGGYTGAIPATLALNVLANPCNAVSVGLATNASVAGSTTVLKIIKQGLTLKVVRASDDVENWYPSGCGSNNFAYTWSYTGQFSGTGTSCNPGPCTCNPCITTTNSPFSDNPNGTVNPAILAGTYSGVSGTGSGTFSVVLRTKVGSSCGNGACFYVVPTTLSISGLNQRPGGGGGDDPELSPVELGLQELVLSPNPTFGKVSLHLANLKAGGRIQISDGNGKKMAVQTHVKQDMEMDVQALPKGLYFVEYISPDGVRVNSKLAVE